MNNLFSVLYPIKSRLTRMSPNVDSHNAKTKMRSYSGDTSLQIKYLKVNINLNYIQNLSLYVIEKRIRLFVQMKHQYRISRCTTGIYLQNHGEDINAPCSYMYSSLTSQRLVQMLTTLL